MNFTNDKNFSDFLDSQVPCALLGDSPTHNPTRYRSQSFVNYGRFQSLESVGNTKQKISSCRMKVDLMIPERVKDINEDSDPFHLFDETSFEEGLRSSESQPQSDFLREIQQPAVQEESRECQ